MAPHPLIGQSFGNYVTHALLGEGGMGIVLAARHRFLDTPAAVKVLHGTYAGNQNASERFFQEAKASIEIVHPDVVKVLDFGQTDRGELYLVMELLDGLSLAEQLAIANRPLRESMAARIGIGIAGVLAAAHVRRIIHRDLKPENVFLTNRRVKVLDFGIAKVLSSSPRTQTGALIGTPQYMAPEQARGDKAITYAVDVYALGVMLFEMVTGRLPFLGETVHALVGQHIDATPPRPTQFARMSTQLERLILACLEKEPAARPASMNDVGAQLDRIVDLSGRSVDDDWRELTTASHQFDAADTMPTSQAGDRSSTLKSAAAEMVGSRRGRVGAGAAVVVIGLTLGGTVIWWSVRSSELRRRQVTSAAAVAPPADVPPGLIITPLPPPVVSTRLAEIPIRIDSVPSDAEIFDANSGTRVGTTPWAGAVVQTGHPHTFRLRRAGYNEEHLSVDENGSRDIVVRFKRHNSVLRSPKKPDQQPTAPVGNTVIDPF